MIPKRSSGFRPSAASTATTAALLLGLAACLALPSPAFSSSPAIASTPGAPRLPVEPEHARMRLIADCTALHPAETAHLGILFDLDPGWHLYGPGRSDSGLPIEISLDTPDGIVAGRTLWPAPERLVSPGGILDQVYSGTVLVILPIHVSPNLPPGSPASFRVDVSWLVCGTGCLPGEGVDQITLPVLARTDSPRPSPEAPLFRETFARIPREISAADPVRFQWREGAWTVRASGARRMTFHPADSCAVLLDPIRDGAANGPRLTLRTAPVAMPPPRLCGVLEVGYAGRNAYYQIEVPGRPIEPQRIERRPDQPIQRPQRSIRS